MDEILKIDTIEQYNNLFGFQTLHPLVSLVDFDAPERQENYRMTIGFYGIFLKETKGCVINYGKSNYDYDDETVVSFAPGQTVGFTRIEGVPPKSIGLLFHPDFIRGGKRGSPPFSRGALGRDQLPVYRTFGITARHRQTHERTDLHEHRATFRLLYAFLRTAVHHPSKHESGCIKPIRKID